MAGVYVDTSALGRVLLGEPDAELIRDALANYDVWWSSALLMVEVRRLARREGFERAAERALAQTRLLDVDGAVLDRASRLDPVEVRSLDAIHLRPPAPDGMRAPRPLPRRARGDLSTFGERLHRHYEQAEDGGPGAYLPDLPGVVALGASRAEVEQQVQEALHAYAEEMLSLGRELPAPVHPVGTAHV